MKKLVALFAVSLSLFAVACGGGQDEAKTGADAPAGDTATPPAGGTDTGTPPAGGADQAAPGGGTTPPADAPKK
jgi:hypothetical protein